MDFMELAKARYSVRSFDQRQIEPRLLEQVLEAGRLAPTAVNRQPQRILVIKTPEGRAKIKKCTKYDFDAPTILLICYDMGEAWANPYSHETYGGVDATLVISQMMLEAAEKGLGTTFVGHFDPEAARTLFNIPSYLHPIALLPIGYPSSDAKPFRLHSERKPLKDTVFIESFEGIQPTRQA